MTAIKTTKPAGTSSQKRSLRQSSDRTLHTAKEQFLAQVGDRVEELIRKGGYNHDRATAAILRELGRGTHSPSDNEIFHLMELQGLGMDDAAKALIVSKAVRKAMKDRGFSAVQAIDDLAFRLGAADLSSPESPSVSQESASIQQNRSTPRRFVTSSVSTVHSQRKPQARKLVKQPRNGKLKTETGRGGNIKNPRKRAVSVGEEQVKMESKKPCRGRSDSVTAEVDAKMATQQSADTSRPAVTPVNKGKRSHMDAVANPSSQPSVKRAREV